MCIVCRAEWEPNVVWAHGQRRRHAGFHTSPTEIWQLAVALGVLTAAFALFLGDEGMRTGELAHRDIYERLFISLIAVGSGFILHELMHKFVAQWYGHWAEFRAQLFGLLVPIPLVLFTPFIIAAPGAVVISGFVQKHENGIISAAGPATNIMIALIAFPFTRIIGTAETLMNDLAVTAVWVNAVLAVFNMLPFGPLDGRKVWRWSKVTYVGIVAAAIGLMVLQAGGF